MTIRMYCDACDMEIDQYTIRPRIDVTIYSPQDGSRLNSWTFCDPCLMGMRNWLQGYIKVRGHLQEPRS